MRQCVAHFRTSRCMHTNPMESCFEPSATHPWPYFWNADQNMTTMGQEPVPSRNVMRSVTCTPPLKSMPTSTCSYALGRASTTPPQQMYTLGVPTPSIRSGNSGLGREPMMNDDDLRRLQHLQTPSSRNLNVTHNITDQTSDDMEIVAESDVQQVHQVSGLMTDIDTDETRSPRRSPRKHPASVCDDSSDDKQRLMTNCDVFVDKINLRKACSLARKSARPGYTLAMKLLPLIFSEEVMANSRGQGLKVRKAGDVRPVLDKTKIAALKDFTTGYCKKNSLVMPGD